MDEEMNKTQNTTGGEEFLELAARQAMHNFVNGDKESLKIALELEHERKGFKPLFEKDLNNQENLKNGRNKR